MALVPVTFHVPKEGWELSQAFAAVYAKAREVLADGWQPGQDLTAIGAEAMKEFIGAVAGISEVPGEVKENPMRSAAAATMAMANAVEPVAGN